jgi:hypothetical protein
MNLETAKTREHAFDALQGYAMESKHDLDQKRTRQPLIKSYMLETVSHDFGDSSIIKTFDETGQTLKQIDDTLYKIFDNNQQKTIGLLERRIPRFPTIYTHEDSKITDPWIKRIVESTPKLDHLWISGMSFNRMLNGVIGDLPGYRYCKVVFQHTKLFDRAEFHKVSNEDDNYDFIKDFDEEDTYLDSHKGTRVSISERLDVIKSILPQLQDIYEPFSSLSQLRFPASGSGGHDLYYDGKITNRSNNFADHRNKIEFVIEFYKRTTESIEEITWHGVERTKLAKNESGEYLVGAPVVFTFDKPLTQEIFDNFISSTFHKKFNRFRLWGNPIKMGARKVHVYALDRHLWQPLFLEITDKKILAMIPQGTCGNTIHRLVTNIQQYLDPKVDVWVGNRNYKEIILGESKKLIEKKEKLK